MYVWGLVYSGIIAAMLTPWVGVSWCIRYYKMKKFSKGKAVVVTSVLLSLLFAALAVQYTIILIEANLLVSYLLWGGIFGFILLMDLVYLRMMLFSRWAKRVTGKIKPRPYPVLKILDDPTK
jgi:hypothetical protein